MGEGRDDNVPYARPRARRRRERGLLRRGVDVVIGYFEPHGRKDTIAMTEGIPLIPRRTLEYRGTAFQEMDTAAILARRPEVCLVDQFPHTNVPGCERNKRWEDVEAILDAGIDVYTTMNVQHLESLNDQISDWDIRLADKQTQLNKQYSDLETTLASLQSQSSWLSSQLSSLDSGWAQNNRQDDS